ncbi:hypothetical protein GCM10028857_07960 [Salinarchaeum chitinilyticum]
MIGPAIAPALATIEARTGAASTSATAPVQSTGAQTEGGSAFVVGLVLITFVVAAVLSTAIAYRLYVGYRGSGDRSMLAIAVGLLLITTVPTVVRIVVPTVLGGADEVRIFTATASELAGLLAIVLAVRTPTRTRRRVRRERATVLPLALLAIAVTVDHVVWLAYRITPLVGSYVTWLAYRGYRRNDSAPMAFLALGIFLLTVVPTAAAIGLGPLLGVNDAGSLLAASLSQLGGLLSVYYSLTRA